MFPESARVAEQAVAALRQALGNNLYSCSVYGSAVRGNALPGASDLNLLIILRESTPKAHQAIAEALGKLPQVDPFILQLAGLERTVQSFAAKFASIQRNYQVVHGEDVLARMQIDPGLQRFLSEQALRNLRLRLVYAFVMRRSTKNYGAFLKRNITPLFVQCSEVARLSGVTVPKAFEARAPLLEQQFAIDGQVLRDLLTLKTSQAKLADRELEDWHSRIIPLLDGVLDWVEAHWPKPSVAVASGRPT